METNLSTVLESDRRRRLSFIGIALKTSTIVTVIVTAVFLCIVCGRSTVETTASVDTADYNINKDLGTRDRGINISFTRPVDVPDVSGLTSTWVEQRPWTNSSQIDHHDYSNVKSGKQEAVRDESNQASFNSTLVISDYGEFKQTERGTAFKDVRRPRLKQYYSHFYGRKYGPTVSPPAMMITRPLRTKYPPSSMRPAIIRPRPLLPPRTMVKNILLPVSKTSEIDWDIVSILALVKVGLIKLKAFGFLKNVFVILFKFKLFLAALFYKAVLVLKLMKFLKTKILSLFVLSLLPILASLFLPAVLGALLSIPGRLQQLLSSQTNSPTTQQSLPSQPANVLPTIRPARFDRKVDSVHAVTGSWLPDQPFHLSDFQGIQSNLRFLPKVNGFRKEYEKNSLSIGNGD